MTALFTAEWDADKTGASGIQASVNLASLPLGRIIFGTTTHGDDQSHLIFRSYLMARHNLKNMLIQQGRRNLILSITSLFFRFDNLTSTRLGQTREIQKLLFDISEDRGETPTLFFGLPETLFGVSVIIESTDHQSSSHRYYL